MVKTELFRSHDALMGALRLAIKEIEKLNFGRKDSRVLRLLRREHAAAEVVAAGVAQGIIR